MAAIAAANAGRSDCDVWPENWPVFLLFCQLQTQWRTGSSGVVGLDYTVLYHKLDRMQLDPAEYEQWEADVCAMEYAALDAMRANKDQAT